MEKFLNRRAAGQILAQQLTHYANNKNVIILALPRGGVPVAFEVAKALSTPLDIFIVRKLGVPNHEEFAMGAIAMGGTTVLNTDIIKDLNIPDSLVQKIKQEEEQELKRREITYRGHKPFPELKNKIIILIDDGIATGATMRAAIQALRKYHPASIVIAVPVVASETYKNFEHLVDEFISVYQPENFYAVGQWYQDFSQTTDEEVCELLLSLDTSE